jgi:hypothetical protein
MDRVEVYARYLQSPRVTLKYVSGMRSSPRIISSCRETMTCMHSVILVIVFDCKCKSWSASSRQDDWASGGDFRLQDYDMGSLFLEFGGAEFFYFLQPWA